MLTNCTLRVDGNILTITADISRKGTLSKTGKSEIVASTGGFTAVDNAPNIGVSLNVCRK